MKLILDERIVREVIDTLYMARTTLLGITGLDSPQEVAKKSANETAITRRIIKAIDIIQQSEQKPMPEEQPSKGLDVTDFCKPIDPGIAQCIADHWWEMLGEDEQPDHIADASKKVSKDLEEAAWKYAEAKTKYHAGWNDGYEEKQKWQEPETASASSIPSCWEEKQKPAENSDFKARLADYMQKASQKDGRYALSSESILKMAEEELLKRGVVQKPVGLPPGFYFIDLDGKRYYSKEFRYGDMKMRVVEQKPAEWSEEDEKCLQEMIRHIEHCVKVYGAKQPEWQQWLNLLKKLMEE